MERAKEWFLLWPRWSVFALLLFYVAFAVYFLAAFESYQEFAPRLAQLENKRGATEFLLLPVAGFLSWQLIAWSVFFGARGVALEFEGRTYELYGQLFYKALWRKFWVLFLSLFLLTLPFWFSVFFLSLGTSWDRGLLLGIFLAQLFLVLFALLLLFVLCLCFRQALLSALMASFIWLLLYLFSWGIEPPLAGLAQWLSPFYHMALLQNGVLHMQTFLFVLCAFLFLFAFLCLFYEKEF